MICLGSPSLEAFNEIRKGGGTGKGMACSPAAALVYLETGKLPQAVDSWPLPESGLKKASESHEKALPDSDTLIDIAIRGKEARLRPAMV